MQYLGARRTLLKRKTIAIAASPTTTFDLSNTSANVGLTNGNLTATNNNTVTGFGYLSAAVAGHSTGKYYYELHADAGTTVSLMMAGIGIPNIASQLFVGSDAGSVGWAGDGTVYLNSSTLTTIQGWAVGNTLCIAVDIGTNQIWFRTNGGNWNNSGTANPATNSGGQVMTGLTAGTYKPMVSFRTQNDAFTANFGGSAYAQSVPSGFGNW